MSTLHSRFIKVNKRVIEPIELETSFFSLIGSYVCGAYCYHIWFCARLENNFTGFPTIVIHMCHSIAFAKEEATQSAEAGCHLLRREIVSRFFRRWMVPIRYLSRFFCASWAWNHICRDVSTGATGATEVAPKFSNTLTLSPPGRGADSAHHCRGRI